MSDRITREVTPFVEVLAGGGSQRTRTLLSAPTGDVLEEDGRVLLRVPGPRGRPQRILIDPDADLFEFVLGTEVERLRGVFEIHLREALSEVPAHLHGATFIVAPEQFAAMSALSPRVGVRIDSPEVELPDGPVEVHYHLPQSGPLPTTWPKSNTPICVVVPLANPEAVEALPQLLFGMGSGQVPARELRLTLDPRAFQVRDRRAPFLSEVVEAVASAAGCAHSQLVREMALRQRMVSRGVRRHLLPDPYLTTWTFRPHSALGLVPATDQFPVPRRSSRREILRGTPESEHERLLQYLSLLEDSAPRASALAQRDLFAVSVHFLANPDLPLTPNHGGICRFEPGVDGRDGVLSPF
ncbi:MAG: hypothetical protein ACI9OJ_001075 [Myxococcota bacterium]|jgi:hypothetical protein